MSKDQVRAGRSTWRAIKLVAVTAAAGLSLFAPKALAAQASEPQGLLQVADMTGGQTPDQLAASLLGGGVAVSNVAFNGSVDAAGTFTGGVDAVGFDRGIVLGSGSVQTHAGDGWCSTGVEGPNECDSNTTGLGYPGDADLEALAGYPTLDATVLEFDFVPTFSHITFNYVFASDEYREYANTQFNDTFAFLVNGTNCATVPSTGEPVSVNTINNGNPVGDPTEHNVELYVDNSFENPVRHIEMDGLTVVLSCEAYVVPGVVNHMKLAIADGSDNALDSNVFIEAGSFKSELPTCGEDGLDFLAGTGLASGLVHDTVEPLTVDAGLIAILPGIAEVLHEINCTVIVPIEGAVDSLIAGLGVG